MSERRAFVIALMAGCATLADGEPGLDATPSANAGPFRLLRSGEVGLGRAAPNVLAEPSFEASELAALRADDESNPLSLVGYVSALFPTEDPDVKVRGLGRVTSIDGRTFGREVEALLIPTEAWEGAALRSPSVARAPNGDVWIAYAGDLGIAVVREDEGVLENAKAPVLRLEDLVEGRSSPQEPGLVFLPDGSARLFYSTAINGGRIAIGVAELEGGLDGTLSFADRGIVLSNAGSGSRVSGPCAVVLEPKAPADEDPDPARAILHLYFASQEDEGARAQIGMAARFLNGSGEALTRSEAVMYRPANDLEAREPSVVRFEDFSMLFVTQRTTEGTASPLVVAGVAPADAALPIADPP